MQVKYPEDDQKLVHGFAESSLYTSKLTDNLRDRIKTMFTNLVILLKFFCFMHKNFKTYVRIFMVGRDDELHELRYGLII
jgi:hypothetical protein